MPARPFYRWKSFWLGILVLAFFGGAWWWSLTHYRAIWFHQGAARWQVSFTVGTVAIERMKWVPASAPVRRLGAVATKVPAVDWRHLPPAFERDPWRRSGDGVGYPTWAFAYWFVALLFLIPWWAMLVWRWRRQRELVQIHDTASAS